MLDLKALWLEARYSPTRAVSRPKMKRLTGAQIVIESLMAEGVDTIFGYPGGTILPTYDALLDSKIRHILVRHEQGATHMAEGYARVAGRPGVVLVTSGPGATNTVTGIANAYMDSTPLVIITGQVPRKMIGNADDFGFDTDTVNATIECFDRGALTSASIMANMPATTLAVSFARVHPEFSFGAHLTYTLTNGEAPMADIRSIPSLIDSRGRFVSANMLRMAVLLGRVSAADIACETTAQLAFLRDCGVVISHVDSHCHFHKFGIFQEALRQVLPHFGIRRVRSRQDIYLRFPLTRPTFWLTAWSKNMLRHQFLSTDHLYMPAPSGDAGWPGLLQKKLNGKGTLEVGVHPGVKESSRHREAKDVERFTTLCKAADCTLINWHDVG